MDFCARAATGPLSLVQVCASLASADTRERELRACDAAMAELGLDEVVLVTLREEEEEVSLEAGTVRIVPAWRWLLGA